MKFTHRLKPLVAGLMLSAAMVTLNAYAQPTAPVLTNVNKVWTYNPNTGSYVDQIAEIVAFDKKTRTLWVIGNIIDEDENVLGSALHVLNAAD